MIQDALRWFAISMVYAVSISLLPLAGLCLNLLPFASFLCICMSFAFWMMGRHLTKHGPQI